MTEHPPLTPLRSQELIVPHGFFTRQGGVSGGIYESLNTSPTSRDAPADVDENRHRVATYFGVKERQLLTLKQVHSAECITVTEPYDIRTAPEADALVTNVPSLILGILTADCVPVLLHDPVAGVIGAAHAGWKGAFAGIIQNTIAAMEKLGAQPEQIIAICGPSIGQASYEVDAAFHDQFLEQSDVWEILFLPSPEQPGTHYLFDNKAYVGSQLAGCGVSHITVMPQDTYAMEDDFFSFRRATHRGESDYGRQVSAIML